MPCEGGKGLTGNNGEKELTGVPSFDIPSAIMRKLKMENPVTCYGRGSQFRKEIEYIIVELQGQLKK